MTRSVVLLIAVAALCAPGQALLGQQQQKEALGVLDFEVRGELAVKDAGAIVAEMFIGCIDDRRYQLYERVQLSRMLKERDLRATDLVADPDKAMAFGKMAQIRYLLVGSISQLGSNMILTARTIDCATGQIGERATVTAGDMNQLPQQVEQCLATMGLSRSPRKGTAPPAGGQTPAHPGAGTPKGAHPEQAQAQYDHALALIGKGDWNGAIAAFREAIRLNPDYAEAHCQLGITLSGQGDINGASAAFKEAIRAQPDYAEAHYQLGVACFMKMETDQAMSAYREAIRLKPEFAPAHFSLGLTLVQKHDLDGAIAEFREAIRLNPADGVSYYSLALAYAERGETSPALKALQKAVELQPAYRDKARADFPSLRENREFKHIVGK